MEHNVSQPTDRSLLWSGLGFCGVVAVIAVLSLLGIM